MVGEIENTKRISRRFEAVLGLNSRVNIERFSSSFYKNIKTSWKACNAILFVVLRLTEWIIFYWLKRTVGNQVGEIGKSNGHLGLEVRSKVGSMTPTLTHACIQVCVTMEPNPNKLLRYINHSIIWTFGFQKKLNPEHINTNDSLQCELHAIDIQWNHTPEEEEIYINSQMKVAYV